MFTSSNVVVILENDVPLAPGLEELAEEICLESNAPLALVKSYMLLAKSDHPNVCGSTLRTKIKEQVLEWVNAPGIKEVLHACSTTDADTLKKNLIACEGIDRVLLSLMFSEFLTLAEIQVCMSWTHENLTKRLARIAEKLVKSERA